MLGKLVLFPRPSSLPAEFLFLLCVGDRSLVGATLNLKTSSPFIVVAIGNLGVVFKVYRLFEEWYFEQLP